jgi:type IV secretory pathway VirB10-like protein
MTTTRPRTAPAAYADITLTGTPTQINRAIRQAGSSGQLVAATTPRPVSTTDPRHRTHLRLRSTHTHTPDFVTRELEASIRWSHMEPRARHRHIPAGAIVALVLVAAVAIAGFIVGYLGLGADLLAKALTILFGLAVAAALISVLPSLVSNGRHHCPGCRH